MIENIKRFVNEHHTLMVVVIGVLVICFIYWWFFYKDKPSANKVKGGGPLGIVLRLNGELKEWIGVFVNNQTKYPFYMLNENGEYLVDHSNDFMNKFNLLFTSLSDKMLKNASIRVLMSRPLDFIYKGEEGKNGITVLHAIKHILNTKLSKENKIKKFLSIVYGDDQLNLLTPLNQTMKESNIFEFSEFFKSTDQVLQLYSCFCNFLDTKLKDFVSKAIFVGQSADKVLKKQVNPHVFQSFIYYSKHDPGSLSGDIHEICANVVRDWYGDKDFKKSLKSADVSPDGEIIITNDDTAEVADIYPAYKLIKMIYFLLLQYPVFCNYFQNGNNMQLKLAYNKQFEDKIDNYLLLCFYLKLISSYVTYVHLFNSMCAIKMSKTWNKNIGNEFVYFFKENYKRINIDNIKINTSMFGELTGNIVGKNHVVKEYFEAFFEGFTESNNTQERLDIASRIITQKQIDLSEGNEITDEDQKTSFNVLKLIIHSCDCILQNYVGTNELIVKSKVNRIKTDANKSYLRWSSSDTSPQNLCRTSNIKNIIENLDNLLFELVQTYIEECDDDDDNYYILLSSNENVDEIENESLTLKCKICARFNNDGATEQLLYGFLYISDNDIDINEVCINFEYVFRLDIGYYPFFDELVNNEELELNTLVVPENSYFTHKNAETQKFDNLTMHENWYCLLKLNETVEEEEESFDDYGDSNFFGMLVDEQGNMINYDGLPFVVEHDVYKLQIPFGSILIRNKERLDNFTQHDNAHINEQYYISLPVGYVLLFKFNSRDGKLEPGRYKFLGKLEATWYYETAGGTAGGIWGTANEEKIKTFILDDNDVIEII